LVVLASRFFVSFISFFGFSVTLLFAVAGAGSAAAGMGASGWAGRTDGESARRTTVLGGGRDPISSGFAAEMVGCINHYRKRKKPMYPARTSTIPPGKW